METLEALEQLVHMLKNTDGSSPFGWSQSDSREPIAAWTLLDAIPNKSQDAAQGNGKSWMSNFQSLYQQLRAIEGSVQAPIVAITGLLNSGKSSLVAGFLSQAGRRRVLIGSANDEGTHRFVLWLPESWKRNHEVWQAVIQQLITVFGCEPEHLAEDIESARQQYNGCLISTAQHESREDYDPRGVPLIATDSMLDQLGIGLLDCPDVQTGALAGNPFDSAAGSARDTFAEKSLSVAHRRAAMLVRASQVCSAFLVVAASNSLHEEKLNDLLDALRTSMPRLRRIIVVNRVPRRYTSVEIAHEIDISYRQLGFDRAYMAYNFLGPLDRERIPIPPWSVDDSAWDGLPIFFQVLPLPAPQPPEAIEPDRYLQNLSTYLETSRLVHEQRVALSMRLSSHLDKGVASIRSEVEQRADRVRRVWQLLADACFEFSKDPNGSATGDSLLRLHASREIVAQISQSLERTAPWWARPGRWIMSFTQSARDMAFRAASSITVLNRLGQAGKGLVDSIISRFRSGEVGRVVSNTALADQLKQFDFEGDLADWANPESVQNLERRCQSMIDRFQSESRTRLNEDELNQFSQEIWKLMSWKQRLWAGVMPAVLVFAPLLAVVALPFDGGSTALVLVTTKELLFAGLASIIGPAVLRDNMPKLAEDEAAWQQLNDLFGIACDELGINRPGEGEFPIISRTSPPRSTRSGQIASIRKPKNPKLPLPIDLNLNWGRSFAQQQKLWIEGLKP